MLHFSCTSCVSFSENRKKGEKVTRSKKRVTPPKKRKLPRALVVHIQREIKKRITKEKWRNKVSKKREEKVRSNLFFHLFVFGAWSFLLSCWSRSKDTLRPAIVTCALDVYSTLQFCYGICKLLLHIEPSKAPPFSDPSRFSL